MTTVTAGPLNDLPARTPSARPTPTRKQEEHLGDDEAVPAPGREGPAVGVGIPVPEKEHGHGQQEPPALAKTPARLSRPERTDPMAGLPVCRLNPSRTFSCPLSFTLALR